MTANLQNSKILIVGNSKEFHVGGHLLRAAKKLGLTANILDVKSAAVGPSILQRIVWRFWDHRWLGMWEFSDMVVRYCEQHRPNSLLVTGLAPLTADALRQIRSIGIPSANWLTDDPWNPKHRSSWFMESLGEYDVVFTPRHANENQIKALGPQVRYMPFAYSPEVHFIEPPPEYIKEDLTCDILFFGGADDDRVPIIEAILSEGYDVHLYGGYWDRYPSVRSVARGMASLKHLRWAVAQAKLTLCLVRRANRDGHVMRTFEAPAMGACMLTEDTVEHRELFGSDDNYVVFFNDIEELLDKIATLIDNTVVRQRITESAYEYITGNEHTYANRLSKMLKAVYD